jgi:hypothetical protein
MRPGGTTAFDQDGGYASGHDEADPPAARGAGAAMPSLSRRASALAGALLLAAVACSGEDAPAPGEPASTLAPTPTIVPTIDPARASDPGAELCSRVAELDRRITTLRAIELRLQDRVALAIELDMVLASYGGLLEIDLGDAEERLEGSLRRLGYRLDELELAVEDFRTNPRPRRAAPHVQEDAGKVAEELDAFTLLSRC